MEAVQLVLHRLQEVSWSQMNAGEARTSKTKFECQFGPNTERFVRSCRPFLVHTLGTIVTDVHSYNFPRSAHVFLIVHEQ